MTISQDLQRGSSDNPAAHPLVYSIPRELLALVYSYLDLDAVIALSLSCRKFYLGGPAVSHLLNQLHLREDINNQTSKSLICISHLYLSFVSFICISYLYLSFVFLICIFYLYFSSVSLICISYLYFLFVSFICISHLYLSFIFLICISYLYLLSVSLICISHLYFLSVFFICISYLYFSFVFLIYIFYLYFLFVFFICISHLYLLSVFLICISHLYFSSVAPVGLITSRYSSVLKKQERARNIENALVEKNASILLLIIIYPSKSLSRRQPIYLAAPASISRHTIKI